jgi:hypothetical protein
MKQMVHCRQLLVRDDEQLPAIFLSNKEASLLCYIRYMLYVIIIITIPTSMDNDCRYALLIARVSFWTISFWSDICLS